MYKIFASIIIFIFLAACNQNEKNQTIKGTITGSGGSIPELAHIHVFPFGDNPYSDEEGFQVNKDGSFSLQLPDLEYLEIMVTASGHQPLLLPLIRENRSESIELKIQLLGNNYLGDYSGVRITGDWNKFGFGSASKMRYQADGTYLFETSVQADSVAYQLLNIVYEGRSVNGTMHDALVYDGGGDYKSVVKTKDDMVTIQFDPSKLISSSESDAPGVQLVKGNPDLQSIIDIALHADLDKNLEKTEKQKYLKQNENLSGFNYNPKPFRDYLQSFIKADKNDLVSRYAMFQLARRTTAQTEGAKEIYQQVIAQLPLEDPLWASEFIRVSSIFKEALGTEKARELFMNTYQNIPLNKVRAGVLVNLGFLAMREGNSDAQSKIYKELKSDYDDIKAIGYYIELLNPDHRIAKGKKVPDFKEVDIYGKKSISNKTLLGKTYLIDFWATWCAPCVEEMPNLHAVYEKYKNKNFTIISFSYDRQLQDVTKFRKDKWEMPWQHIYLTGSKKEQISKEFELDGIPKPILIDAEGTIIATEFELRGDDLEKTISKYLDN